MEFLVVEFPDDNPTTVEVIPRKWLISNSECHWPPRCNSRKLNKLRRARAVPLPKWGRCRCRILGEFGTYESAQEASKKAENTSELESTNLGERRQKTKPLSSSESDSSECCEPPPKTLKPSKPTTDDLYPPPNNPLYSVSAPSPALEITAPSTIPEGFVQYQIPTASPSTFTSNNGNHSLIYLDLNTSQQIGVNEEVQSSIASQTITVDNDAWESYIHRTPQSSQNVEPINQTGHNFPQGFQKVVLKHLAAIQSTQRDILQKLEVVLENQAVRISVGDSEGSGPSLFDLSTLPIFPLETEEALSQFDSQLAIESEREIFTRYMIGIGGRTLEETVKGILKRVIHEDLAKKLSYTGKGKNRKPFNIYSQIDRCITAATKKNKKIPNAAEKTEVAIRMILMDFFRYSREKKEKL